MLGSNLGTYIAMKKGDKRNNFYQNEIELYMYYLPRIEVTNFSTSVSQYNNTGLPLTIVNAKINFYTLVLILS